MIRAVIFDLDGVLIDSEREYFKLNKGYLEARGFRPSDQDIYSIIGCSMDGNYAKLLSFYPEGTMTMGRLQADYVDYSRAHPIDFARLAMPGARELLAWLREQGIRTAVASSSPSDYIAMALEKAGLAELIELTVSGEEFTHNKPDPEVYLRAAERLGLPKGECLVVEDSAIGLQAGRKAGILTAGLAAFGSQDLSLADLRIARLGQLRDKIEQLGRVVRIPYRGKELVLVPVAHVSKDSAELAHEVIVAEHPDSIAVELDADRLKSFEQKNKWESTDIVRIIKDGKIGYFLVNLLLANYQRRLAKQLDSSSGKEMLEGVEAARERKIPLVLADRSVQTTFTRIWRGLTGRDKLRLLNSAVGSLFDNEELTEEDIAKLAGGDELQSALKQLQDQFPAVSAALVTERDQYLAYKIKNAPGPKVVAILGAAHVAGLGKWIGQDYPIAPLDELPPKKKTGKAILWSLSIILIALVVFTFMNNRELGTSQIWSWIVWHGALSALGCALCLAHPLTVLVGFLAAPISALSPLLASGWFAGLCEAYLRKPTVKDFQQLPEDVSSFKGFWHNKVTKTLMIVVLSNVGSTAASLIGTVDIVSKFLQLFR